MPDIYRYLLIVTAGGIAAFFLHVELGWIWTVAAGLGVGLAARCSGWWYGGLAVLLDYAVLIGWNLAVAAGPTLRMAETMGQLMGNMPGWAFVGVTLFTGFGLGAVGGFVGQRVRLLARHMYALTAKRNAHSA